VLRVLTLNIWNLAGPWRERRVEILAWLDLLQPDVVCLQEVVQNADGRNQARWLAEASSVDWDIADGPAVETGDGWFGNAVLSRQQIDKTSVVSLFFVEREGDAQRSVVHARTGGVDVFCTHLNWQYEDGWIREQQVLDLVDAVGQLADPESPLPPIVCGDMNAEPDSTEMRFLAGLSSMNGRSVYFQDAWRVAGGRGPGFTWDNRNPFAAAEFEPDRRIDYIYAGWRRHGGAGRIESARVACNRSLTGTYATDHFGLVADIQT
jgi:endonuclease/exonuclease/phosphatase family metal-dependent hydrolase